MSERDPTRQVLAAYIVRFLRERNNEQLELAIGAMTVHDYENLHAELEAILVAGGRPSNWVKREG